MGFTPNVKPVPRTTTDVMACAHSTVYIYKTWNNFTLNLGMVKKKYIIVVRASDILHPCSNRKHILDLRLRNCFSISPSLQTDLRSLFKRISEANKFEFAVCGAYKG